MTWLGPENARLVEVPDVVGLEVSTARKVAWAAGLVLVAPDPDGPPLGALTWPGNWTVTAQSLQPGSTMHYRGSMTIQFSSGAPAADGPRDSPPPGDSPGNESGDREPRPPNPSPSALSAEQDIFEATRDSVEGRPGRPRTTPATDAAPINEAP